MEMARKNNLKGDQSYLQLDFKFPISGTETSESLLFKLS